jgi:hypothetical protein
LVVENLGTYAVFFVVLAGMFVSVVDRGVSALLSPTAGLTVLAICVSQLIRVWREFFVDHSYRTGRPQTHSNSAFGRLPDSSSSPCTWSSPRQSS